MRNNNSSKKEIPLGRTRSRFHLTRRVWTSIAGCVSWCCAAYATARAVQCRIGNGFPVYKQRTQPGSTASEPEVSLEPGCSGWWVMRRLPPPPPPSLYLPFSWLSKAIAEHRQSKNYMRERQLLIIYGLYRVNCPPSWIRVLTRYRPYICGQSYTLYANTIPALYAYLHRTTRYMHMQLALSGCCVKLGSFSLYRERASPPPFQLAISSRPCRREREASSLFLFYAKANSFTAFQASQQARGRRGGALFTRDASVQRAATAQPLSYIQYAARIEKNIPPTACAALRAPSASAAAAAAAAVVVATLRDITAVVQRASEEKMQRIYYIPWRIPPRRRVRTARSQSA
uniref:Uncharacterized protein n=1 Tax=Trichogramma kaykai TaxID=54128 RepID=A0ABD2XBW5_9HYME